VLAREDPRTGKIENAPFSELEVDEEKRAPTSTAGMLWETVTQAGSASSKGGGFLHASAELAGMHFFWLDFFSLRQNQRDFHLGAVIELMALRSSFKCYSRGCRSTSFTFEIVRQFTR
jgi:hypothetical protein